MKLIKAHFTECKIVIENAKDAACSCVGKEIDIEKLTMKSPETFDYFIVEGPYRW